MSAARPVRAETRLRPFVIFDVFGTMSAAAVRSILCGRACGSPIIFGSVNASLLSSA
jgi:hypothetical protein